jgi:hypothetical protein
VDGSPLAPPSPINRVFSFHLWYAQSQPRLLHFSTASARVSCPRSSAIGKVLVPPPLLAMESWYHSDVTHVRMEGLVKQCTGHHLIQQKGACHLRCHSPHVVCSDDTISRRPCCFRSMMAFRWLRSLFFSLSGGLHSTLVVPLRLGVDEVQQWSGSVVL